MSSQRERQRERERNQRQLTTPSMPNNSNNSLFAEPIKQSIEDETTKRIKSTLGDFDSVKLLLINDNKPLLGISTREITRIKGHKAKIEQILSEMKNTLEPITALDDFSDETNAKYINNNNNSNYSDEHIVNSNEQQRNTQSFDRNNRRINSNNNDFSFDNTSGDEKVSNNHKPSNSKKRKSSKSDAENGSKRNGTKLTKSTSSSNSSESSSNSSSISSSSSESSDDEEKESDNISSKQEEEIPNSRQETPKTSQAPQTEIAVWDLETFMDKKTTTTTNTSTTVSSNTITTIKSSSYDNIADTIDRVAKGELGDNMSSSSGSPEPTPKKKRKSTQNSESIRNEHSKQNSSSNQSQYKSSKHNQNSSPIQDFVFEPHIKQMKSDQQKPLLTPKSLIVSIKLMLLKRIPGQTYSNTISSNSSNRSNSSISVDTSIANDENNSNFAKSKLTQNVKTERRSIKTENANKSRDSNSKLNNSSMSKPSKQQMKDNDSRNSEHTSSSFRDNTSLSNSLTIKEEPHSPLVLPPLTSAITTIPPPPTTVAANITPTLMRTPPEISPSVGQPDDFLSAAKRIKHAADRETDRTVQACKYLEAVLYFILTGNAMELSGNETEKVCVMYKETLNLIRQITNKFAKSRSSHSADIPTTDHKLTTLSYRCQSLLFLKLSRLKSREIRDNNKSIQQQSLEINNNSNTNSTTIPTSLLNVFQRQLLLLQQYHTAHDLWQQADHLIEKHASCKAFFVALDNVAGCLSLNSTFDHLVHYVRTGLQILK